MNNSTDTGFLPRFSYDPFGMITLGRSWDVGSGYRYGFNGKEQDDEISGNGNQYDYGFRIYNSRLGKFLSVDPLAKSYAWYTPYQFAGNKPIAAIDLDGQEEYFVVRYYNEANELAFTAVIKVPDAVQVPGLMGSLYLELSANVPAEVTIFQNVFGVTPEQAEGLMSTAGPGTMNVFTPFRPFGTSSPDANKNFKFSNIINNTLAEPFLVGTYIAPTTTDANGLRPYERDVVTNVNVIAYDDPASNGNSSSAYIVSISTRTVFFDLTNMTTLDPGDQAILNAPANVLNAYPSLTATIEGNTDTDNTSEANYTLGGERASAVSTYIQSSGVDSSRLSVSSNGESRARGVTDAEKALDRNATIKVNYPSRGN